MLAATRRCAVHAGKDAGRTLMPLLVVALGVAVAGAGCSKRSTSAAACVDIAGPACQECRTGAKAQFCGAQYVAPQASDKSRVNGQKGCCGFEDPKLRAQCQDILLCIRTKGCGVGSSPTRCLCGDLDPMSCARALKPHTGACADVYRAAVAGESPADVIKVFGDPKSPLGVANNTFTCDVDASCPCGKSGKR
jgi:hypothetical protein